MKTSALKRPRLKIDAKSPAQKEKEQEKVFQAKLKAESKFHDQLKKKGYKVGSLESRKEIAEFQRYPAKDFKEFDLIEKYLNKLEKLANENKDLNTHITRVINQTLEKEKERVRMLKKGKNMYNAYVVYNEHANLVQVSLCLYNTTFSTLYFYSDKLPDKQVALLETTFEKEKDNMLSVNVQKVIESVLKKKIKVEKNV